MKKIVATSAALVLGASAAFAGGMAEPVEIAPVEILDDTAGGSSAGLIVPLIIIALIAAAVGSSDGGSSDTTEFALN